MNNNQFHLTRQQFIVAAGLGAVAAGTAACSGYGQQPSAAGADSGADQSAPPSGGGTPIAATAEVPIGSGVIVDDIVVTQPRKGVFQAFSAVCTHAGCTLADVSGGTINCRCHGSKFNLDGTVANGPASRPLEVRSITVGGGGNIFAG